MSTPAGVATEVLLCAGGLVSVDAPLPAETHSDLVSARTYRHPALGDRVVVRLPSKPLAPAEDLELDLLGFAPPRASGDVARRRRRALGFPGWALVHQPKRAAIALGLVKEMKKASKLARSKPGHAKDAFDAMGKRLARSVPAFLPSFFEEAGRAFIEHGNVSYAATMFAKAREAEKEHALKVDAETRQTAFLEFALAGALSGKVLTEYGAELSASEPPPVAYARFRELAVRRLLGGMPPWAGMGTELRRLGKAAKLDEAKEDEAFLREVLDAPVLARAPGEFWNTYEPALVAVCHASDAARLALLKLTPAAGYSDRGEKIARWLTLLDACGALAPLECPQAVAPAAFASIRPAEWLKRMVAVASGWHDELSEELPSVLRRLAPRLKEEAEPLSLFGRWSWMDLDLLDLALELGVPVVAPESEAQFHFRQWAKRGGTSKSLGRDPAYVAADPRFRKALEQAVAGAFGEAGFDAAARGKPVLASLRRAHLDTLVTPAGEGLPAFARQLATLEKVTSAATFAEFPEAFPKLMALSVRPNLEFTLRSGIADELGWPALDEAVAELAPQHGVLQYDGFFPYLCIYNEVRVIVLGPKGRVLEHDFRIPPRHQVQGCYFVGGQLRVMLRGPQYERFSYWSRTPTELLPGSGYWGREPRPGVELSDGSLMAGGRALTAADTVDAPGDRIDLVCDGTTFWVWQFESGKQVLVEVDPRTGKRGRRSWPSFFTQGLNEGEGVSRQGSALLPVPPEVTASPLGVQGGLSGVRWRAGKAERIDGLTVPSPESVGALASLPGGAVLIVSASHRATEVRALAETAGTSVKLSPPYWHYLSARDVAGSEALRRVDTATCEKLLSAALPAGVAAVAPDLHEGEAPRLTAATVECVARLLPEVTHPALRQGVAGVAMRAAEFSQRLARHLEAADPSRAGSTSAPTGRSDEHLKRAVAGICGTGWNSEEAFDQVSQAADFFAGRRPPRLARSAVSWADLIGRGGALAFVASSPGFGAEQRTAAADFLEAFAGTPFFEGKSFRRLVIDFAGWKKLGGLSAEGYQGTFVYSFGESTYLGVPEHDGLHGVEHSKSGGFRLPTGATLKAEEPITPSALTTEAARGLVEAVRSRGVRPFDRAPVDFLSQQTGLTYAEAALLWLGFPGFATREANFLDKSVREAVGLKMNEARAARETFEGLPRDTRAELLAEGAGASPLELYDAPLAVAQRLAGGWNRRFGKRAAVPAEVVAQAHAELHRVLPPPAVLGAMLEPSGTAYGRDGWFKFVDEKLNFGPKPGEPNDVFTHDELVSAAAFIPWVFQSLPVGHPIRNGLPRFLEAVRARLANPELVVPIGSPHAEEGPRAAILQALGDKPDVSQARLVDAGAVVALVRVHGYFDLFLRPSQWHRGHAHAPLLRSLQYWGPGETLKALEVVTSDAFTRLATRVAEARLPAGAYEANPAASAPQLVKRAQKSLGLGAQAAQLYLQLLALPFPSSAAVQTYNGWTAQDYAQVVRELVKKKVVLEAKRERAGREIFLPGGWEPLKAPLKPLESWKLPLFGATRVGDAVQWPLAHQLPIEPLHEVFERAWKRIEDGDVPRYDEVKA